MAQQNETNTLLGIVSVTTSKTTERDWLGRTTNETSNLTIEIIAAVPQPLIDAAELISKAAPRLLASATSLVKTTP